MMINNENVFEVLSAENELNPAPLGDVEIQAAVNVELSNRLTSYWHGYLPETVVSNGLAVAAAFEQQNRAKYQRLNRELIVREGISPELKPIFDLATKGLANYDQLLDLYLDCSSIHTIDLASYTHGGYASREELFETLCPAMKASFTNKYEVALADEDMVISEPKYYSGLSRNFDPENFNGIERIRVEKRFVKLGETEDGIALMARLIDFKIIFADESQNIDDLIDRGLFKYDDSARQSRVYYIPVSTSFFVCNMRRNKKMRKRFL